MNLCLIPVALSFFCDICLVICLQSQKNLVIIRMEISMNFSLKFLFLFSFHVENHFFFLLYTVLNRVLWIWQKVYFMFFGFENLGDFWSMIEGLNLVG